MSGKKRKRQEFYGVEAFKMHGCKTMLNPSRLVIETKWVGYKENAFCDILTFDESTGEYKLALAGEVLFSLAYFFSYSYSDWCFVGMFCDYMDCAEQFRLIFQATLGFLLIRKVDKLDHVKLFYWEIDKTTAGLDQYKWQPLPEPISFEQWNGETYQFQGIDVHRISAVKFEDVITPGEDWILQVTCLREYVE
jgi:hypothetical protein